MLTGRRKYASGSLNRMTRRGIKLLDHNFCTMLLQNILTCTYGHGLALMSAGY